MCRDKWFEFFGEGVSADVLQRELKEKRVRDFMVHSKSAGGRDDLFGWSPSKCLGTRADSDLSGSFDLCGGIVFGSPICASPASVGSIGSEDLEELEREGNSLFFGKGLGKYFEGTFGMRKKFVKCGKGFRAKEGVLCVKEEKEEKEEEKGFVGQADNIVMEQKKLGLRTVLSPGGTVRVECSKEVEDDEAEFDYDSDGNMVEDESF